MGINCPIRLITRRNLICGLRGKEILLSVNSCTTKFKDLRFEAQNNIFIFLICIADNEMSNPEKSEM